MKNLSLRGVALFLFSGLTMVSCSFLDEGTDDNPIREEYRMNTDKEGKEAKLGDINAVIQTNKGNIHVRLYAAKTPLTVANFLNLSRKGYYNGLTFHRVIKGFVIQGGDPTGTGAGGPGYKFRDEIRSDLKHDSEGILSMANSGPNTNGSQFFITHAATPHLDGKHTVFGVVTSGMSVVNQIEQGDIIRNIMILGSTDVLFNKEKANLDLWNQYLGQR